VRLARTGATLPELLVAAALTGLVASAALLTLRAAQRSTQAVAEQAAAGAGVRTAAQLLLAELGRLGAVRGGDLLVLEPDRVVFRAGRGAGVACGTEADGLLVREATFRSLRLPAAGRDSLDLLLPDTAGATRWLSAGLAGPPRSAWCADGGRALALPLTWTTESPADPSGSPVRIWEVMEIRAYASGGEWWLGVRSVSAGEAIQPVVGPLTFPGVRFGYRDALGRTATDPRRVARIDVVVRLVGSASVAAGGAARGAGRPADSLFLAIPLVNAAW
jgi:hypothetical protein